MLIGLLLLGDDVTADELEPLLVDAGIAERRNGSLDAPVHGGWDLTKNVKI